VSTLAFAILSGGFNTEGFIMSSFTPHAEDTSYAPRIVDNGLFEDGSIRNPIFGLFPRDLAVLPLPESLAEVALERPHFNSFLSIALAKARMLPADLYPELTLDEKAAIVLFTMEAAPSKESVSTRNCYN
jgi:hypothetical protein